MKANFSLAALGLASFAVFGLHSAQVCEAQQPASPDTPLIQTGRGIRTDTLVYATDNTSATPFIRQLSQLGNEMRANQNFRIVVTGNGGPGRKQHRENRARVNAVIDHLSETYGIDRSRFVVEYTEAGSSAYVKYQLATAGDKSTRE